MYWQVILSVSEGSNHPMVKHQQVFKKKATWNKNPKTARRLVSSLSQLNFSGKTSLLEFTQCLHKIYQVELKPYSQSLKLELTLRACLQFVRNCVNMCDWNLFILDAHKPSTGRKISFVSKTTSSTMSLRAHSNSGYTWNVGRRRIFCKKSKQKSQKKAQFQNFN